MDHAVYPELKGPLKIRRGKCIVKDGYQLQLPRDRGYKGDIYYAQLRIGRGLKKNEPCPSSLQGRYLFTEVIAGVEIPYPAAELREDQVEEIPRPSVDPVARDP